MLWALQSTGGVQHPKGDDYEERGESSTELRGGKEMAHALIVGTDIANRKTYPVDFLNAHARGIPHRAVQIEVTNARGEYLVWEAQKMLEIPGGHVDWDSQADRPESYEEAACRELMEELRLLEHWHIAPADARARLHGSLHCGPLIINQLSTRGFNNEFVVVFTLAWQDTWGNPCEFTLEEGHTAPRWLTLEAAKQESLRHPINSALRLFFQRRGILIPIWPRR
jgi:8-oxo-dGTP pyrophosphatase MutT (NUDIX family)